MAETWLGVTFMEEGPRRGEQRRNWVFARIQLGRDGKMLMYPKLRAQALTASARQQRIPELTGLSDARVVLIGAGSLGSAVAFELVKAGVGHLDVVDSDVFDVNNSVRHVLAPTLAGWNKAASTAVAAAQLNPFVEVEHHGFTVGLGANEQRHLRHLVAQSTVVVDTTGSQAVGRILQKYCARAGKPLVVAGLTAGSYGGEIAVLRPGGPCLACFVLAQNDGDMQTPNAAPPSPQVTPIGCSHPAFSGAGFDATELAAIVARTVIQATEMSEYPALEWDWAIVNFRGEPRWATGLLTRHAGCPAMCPMTLWLDRRALALIEREALKRRLDETGGALFGYEGDSGVVVAYAFGPGLRGKHGPRSFAPHKMTTAGLIRLVEVVRKFVEV